ncbi:GNAT family N-acetyltransferase [Gallibacterium salpingitidis]|uniref:GNAT family N-acetyltransferase n=1 Tax=Gallibacterium salpingitidis TaxID=505341 RepID=UPI0026703A77|nr:GNAT family N-acetyltransferase [Gallibacterium salpingitidis]WKS98534.1 GNAT family N-acetyltransferase [Gallibacterium salpingitidis]
MHITPMQITDYDAVYQLWLSCKGMGLNDLDDSQEGITRFLQRNPDTCFVAKIEQKIVGVILAGNDGRRGYIYHTAVAPNYRNQGIATMMVEKVLQQFQQLKIHKVALLVFTHNQQGNRFWEKLGFTLRNDVNYRNKSLVELVRIDT